MVTDTTNIIVTVKRMSRTLPLRLVHKLWQIGQVLSLPLYIKSCIVFRLEYLHSILAHSKTQGQGNAHLCDRYGILALAVNSALNISYRMLLFTVDKLWPDFERCSRQIFRDSHSPWLFLLTFEEASYVTYKILNFFNFVCMCVFMHSRVMYILFL